MEAHWFTATEEISSYRQCWENDGSHVLRQRKRDTHCVPKSTTVTGETYEDVLQTKFLPASREKRPKKAAAVLSSQQRSSSLGGSCSPVFQQQQQLWSCSSCSLLTWPCTRWFLVLSNTEGHSLTLRGSTFLSHSTLATAIFQCHNETLKKCLLRPCNCGVSIVKNVYVYRVITLRNDGIFSFLG